MEFRKMNEIEILVKQQLKTLEKLKEQIEQLKGVVESLETIQDLR